MSYLLRKKGEPMKSFFLETAVSAAIIIGTGASILSKSFFHRLVSFLADFLNIFSPVF